VTLNLVLRIVGLATAITMLCLAGTIPHVALIATFLGGFALHYSADLSGDDLFRDEPLGVAITRHVGFGAAVALGLAGGFAGFSTEGLVWSFIGSLATHLTGDALSVRNKIMAFDVEEYLKLPAFLQFVGLMVAAGALFLSGAGHGAKIVGFLGLGFSLAGFVYEKIYQ
jgi:hypothetical protein